MTMKLSSFILPAFLFAACLGALPAKGATPSLEDRLAKLEAALNRLEARLGDTVSADELAPTLKEYSDLTK